MGLGSTVDDRRRMKHAVQLGNYLRRLRTGETAFGFLAFERFFPWRSERDRPQLAG
jgi:hypothetical protein